MHIPMHTHTHTHTHTRTHTRTCVYVYFFKKNQVHLGRHHASMDGNVGGTSPRCHLCLVTSLNPKP